MESKKITKTSKDVISPKKQDIPLSYIKFINPWVFWENYSSKSVQLNYEEANKQIFKWNDIITFFQFWNKYPGSDLNNIFYDGNSVKYYFKEKLRIIAINIFKDEIKPLWEDEKNNGGKYFQIDYLINPLSLNEFTKKANHNWKKLALCTMGGAIPGTEFINGIRFIDKTNFERGNKILFRIEIWISKNIQEKTLNELKDFFEKSLGHIVVKDIKIESKK